MNESAGSGHWVGLDSRAWWIESVWAAAAGIDASLVPLAEIAELDQDCWFAGNGQKPTVRAIADHARRIADADVSIPIILAADGQILDGMHRIAKAHLLGEDVILARRLAVDPEPDWRVDGSGRPEPPAASGPIRRRPE